MPASPLIIPRPSRKRCRGLRPDELALGTAFPGKADGVPDEEGSRDLSVLSTIGSGEEDALVLSLSNFPAAKR